MFGLLMKIHINHLSLTVVSFGKSANGFGNWRPCAIIRKELWGDAAVHVYEW